MCVGGGGGEPAVLSLSQTLLAFTDSSAEDQFVNTELSPSEEHQTPSAQQTIDNTQPASQSASSGASPQQTRVEGSGESAEKGQSSPSSSDTIDQLKAALKQGAKVVTSPPLNPHSHAFVPVSPPMLTKLNPGAQPFTPSVLTDGTSGLNPTSVTNGRGASSDTRSSFSPKFPIFGSGAGSGTTPNLNPHSQEFVPRSLPAGKSLNAQAPEFVPKVGLPPGMQNGDPSLTEQFDLQQEDELLTLQASDIVQGFEKVYPQAEGTCLQHTKHVYGYIPLVLHMLLM